MLYAVYRRVMFAVVLCWCACLAAGQDAVPGENAATPDEAALLSVLIEDLGAEDLETREGAQAVIQTLDGRMLPQIEHALAGDSLDIEQRQRLVSAGQSVFARSPRAAMGIQFGGPTTDGVMIQNTVADGNFDAQVKLAANDIILEAGGEPMEGMEDLRIAIISRDPGEVVPLKVMRNGEVFDVAVELGSFADLTGSRIDSNTAQRSWAARLVRRGIWAEVPTLSFVDQASPDAGVTREPRDIEAGAALREQSGGGTVRQLTIRQRERFLAARPEGEDPFTRSAMMRELADLRIEYNQSIDRIARNERRLLDDNTDNDDRMRLRASIQTERVTVAGLERRMKVLMEALVNGEALDDE